jgi:aerobic-type carbon monoxide dehydrogenase small subunit (CoxS/CutS family)
MDLTLHVNGTDHRLQAAPGETLLIALRRVGYFGVKHGWKQAIGFHIVAGGADQLCVMLARLKAFIQTISPR